MLSVAALQFATFATNAQTCAPLVQTDCGKNAACKWTTVGDLAGSIGDFFNGIIGSLQSKSISDVGVCMPATMITVGVLERGEHCRRRPCCSSLSQALACRAHLAAQRVLVIAAHMAQVVSCANGNSMSMP